MDLIERQPYLNETNSSGLVSFDWNDQPRNLIHLNCQYQMNLFLNLIYTIIKLRSVKWNQVKFDKFALLCVIERNGTEMESISIKWYYALLWQQQVHFSEMELWWWYQADHIKISQSLQVHVSGQNFPARYYLFFVLLMQIFISFEPLVQFFNLKMLNNWEFHHEFPAGTQS